MPIIHVEMFTGRTQEQKRELAKELTTAFVKVAGSSPQNVHVIMTDVNKGDWSTGGELCSDKFPD